MRLERKMSVRAAQEVQLHAASVEGGHTGADRAEVLLRLCWPFADLPLFPKMGIPFTPASLAGWRVDCG
jgi:hypothetical protein